MSEQQQLTAPKVFAAIEGVMSDIAKLGVGKHQTNTQQNFKYRGIDDVMDALSPLLAKHHLIILPKVGKHSITERMTANQRPVLHAVLEMHYTFVSPIDASREIVGPIYGEAMDSGDKATNKAMAAAYKYLCTHSFCIPFSGAVDPDAQSHELAGTPPQRIPATPGPEPESPSVAPPVRSAASPGNTLQPDRRRPGGMFTYGKKHANVPWNVVPTDYLEWALNAERTPMDVRQRIVDELAWRDYELARMHEQDEKARIEREKPFDDEIPYEAAQP